MTKFFSSAARPAVSILGLMILMSVTAGTSQAQQFCNPAPISIPSQGAANPYPSNITVSGLSGSTVGVTDSHTISSAITSITNITVSLQITGGFNGDYYAYLVHSSGFAVLLNRIGRTSSNDLGNSGSGINVTFDDLALSGDIHLAPNASPLTGMWDPDARNVNPSSSLDTSPRTAFLDSFNGLDASGTWTLFVSDAGPVSTGTFASWTLNITGIPEPGTFSLALLGIGTLAYFYKRARARRP